MKAKEILKWMLRESVECELVNILDVPAEDDEFSPQDEEWWQNMLGAIPPAPLPSGEYVYYWRNSYDEIKDEHGNIVEPDATIEDYDHDDIFLYRLED